MSLNDTVDENCVGSEPCIIDAGACDIKNMEYLCISRFNPIYLFAKVKQYFSKGSGVTTDVRTWNR